MSKAVYSAASSLPPGAAIPINTKDALYTAPDKSKWLRSGTVEDDPSVYPDAPTTAYGNTGEIYSVAGYKGLYQSATRIYCLSFGSVTVYDKSFVDIVNEGFLTSAIDSSAESLVGSGLKLWMVGNTNNTVYELDLNGAVTSSFYVGGLTSAPQGICLDDNGKFWLAASNGNIFRLKGDGSYDNFTFSTGQAVTDLEFKAGNIWALDPFGVSIFDVSGGYIGRYGFEANCQSLMDDGAGALWVAKANNKIFRHSTIVGMDVEKIHSETGLHYFIKATR